MELGRAGAGVCVGHTKPWASVRPGLRVMKSSRPRWLVPLVCGLCALRDCDRRSGWRKRSEGIAIGLDRPGALLSSICPASCLASESASVAGSIRQSLHETRTSIGRVISRVHGRVRRPHMRKCRPKDLAYRCAHLRVRHRFDDQQQQQCVRASFRDHTSCDSPRAAC